MENSQKDRLRAYAWNYFVYHAEQRIKAFNLYLIIVAILIGGFGTVVVKIEVENMPWLSIFGFVLLIISAAFALLDKRSKELVRNGEAALKYLDELEGLPDEGSCPNILKIFSRDDYVSSNKSQHSINRLYVSYSAIFRIIFLLFGLLGLATSVICLIN
jgi:hypothetical protein